MSRLAYTATAFLFALSATVASAQAPQPVPPAAAPGPVVKVLPSIPANAATVTNWHKQSVYDPSDAKVGEVMDVLVDRDGKIVALIVGVGGRMRPAAWRAFPASWRLATKNPGPLGTGFSARYESTVAMR